MDDPSVRPSSASAGGWRRGLSSVQQGHGGLSEDRADVMQEA